MLVNALSEAMLNNNTFNETFDKTPPSSQVSHDLSEIFAKNVEEILDMGVVSQASQASSENSDKNFEMDDHTASSQSSISDDREIVQSDGRPLTQSQSISNTNQESLKPIQVLLSEPQVKRLSLNFKPEHANIEACSIPENLLQVRRICQESDFLLKPDKKSTLEHLKSELFLYAMLQLNGSF